MLIRLHHYFIFIIPLKHLLLAFIFIFLCLAHISCRNKVIDPPDSWRYSWEASVRGTEIAIPNSISIASDSQHNIYVGGTYDTSLQFPLTPHLDESVTIREDNRNDHGYLFKLDTNGNIEWIRSWGGIEGRADVQSVSSDDPHCVFVAGNFNGTVDFDPGPDQVEKTSRHVRRCYIAEFNNDGNLSEVRVLEVNDPRIAVGKNGMLFVVGLAEGATSFAPRLAQETHGLGNDRTTCLMGYDTAGELSFASSWGASWQICLDVDFEGRPLVCGSFQGVLDLDSGDEAHQYSSSAGEDIYVARFSEFGELEWTTTWGGVDTYRCNSMAVDGEGHAYIVGSRLDLREYEATHRLRLSDFLVKFDNHGNHEWTRFWEAGGRNSSIAVNESGNVFVTGAFDGTVDFNPDEGIEDRTSSYGEWDTDAYLGKYSSDGELLDVGTWGSSGPDKGHGIVVAPSGIYVVSYWNRECFILEFSNGNEW